MFVVVGGMIIFFVSMFASIATTTGPGHPSSEPPPMFLIFVPLIWGLAMFGWVANLVLGIMYGIKANRGEWAGYPIIGKWCMPKLAPTAPAPNQTWAP